MTATEVSSVAWGVDSEYGRLLDVLLCPPDHFRWRATSPISEATLASGRVFDSALARAQHAELVRCYEEQGVSCHFLEADPALPYQVFARDSSAATPAGGVVLQPKQPWRRGEYAAVLSYYQQAGIPLRGVVTAGSIEGGDVMVLEPGLVLIGCGEARTQEAGARQLAGWFEADGWEVRIEPFPARYVHMDVLVASLAEKLVAVCLAAVSGGLVSWLRAKGFEIVDVPEQEAFTLGVNAMSLGDDRVLSGAGATTLNAALRARGITVVDPDLSAFTLGGGGAHCLAQALRRERVG
jgi:N-dimethylarginine dimethylaminohydrolase